MTLKTVWRVILQREYFNKEEAEKRLKELQDKTGSRFYVEEIEIEVA